MQTSTQKLPKVNNFAVLHIIFFCYLINFLAQKIAELKQSSTSEKWLIEINNFSDFSWWKFCTLMFSIATHPAKMSEKKNFERK